TIIVIVLLIPVLIMISSGKAWHHFIGLAGLGAIAGLVSGCSYIFVLSLFSPEERFSGVAFSYNLGIALFGGTSPIISLWLVETTGLAYAPSAYIITLGTILLITLGTFH